MEKHRKELIKLIIYTYIAGFFPQNIEDEFYVWLIQEDDFENKDEVLFELWNSIKTENNKSTDRAFSLVMRRLSFSEVNRNQNVRRKLTIIAAVVIPMTIILGSLFYKDKSYSIYTGEKVCTQAIISLEDEAYKYAVLDDSSKVWVKKGTILYYGSDRKAELNGEAFFDVTKNGSKEFVVKTKFIYASVIGTKFNIHAYPTDENTIISLYEGGLNVKGDKFEINLKGGDELVYNQNTEDYFIRQISGNKPDWLRQTVRFEHALLETIFDELERIYDVTINYDKTSFKGHYLLFKFEEDAPVADIISYLSIISGRFNYTIQDEKLIIITSKY